MWVAWGGRRGGWVCQDPRGHLQTPVLSHWALEGRDGVPGCPQHPKDCVTPTDSQGPLLLNRTVLAQLKKQVAAH